MFRKIVEKYHPIIHIGGHVHESRGTQKFGRTVSVNPGAAGHGEYAILDFPIDKNGKLMGKIRVRMRK